MRKKAKYQNNLQNPNNYVNLTIYASKIYKENVAKLYN